MKSSTVLALIPLLAAASVVAQPHAHQHRHAARKQDKRDLVVVWETDVVYVTEVVDVTTTFWVSDGFVAPESTTPSPVAATTSTTKGVPAQFFVPAASQPASSSSVYVPPPPPPVSVAPAPVAPVYTPPVVAPASVAPAYVPPVEAPAPAPVPTTAAYVAPAAPVAQPSTPAAAPAAAPASSGGTGECSSGSPCSGDITYYEAGLGACGYTNDGEAENVIALPHGLMGTQSNGNPYCGREVTIRSKSSGKTVTAKVVDKCMGCTGYSIDLSNKAFSAIADFAVGRTGADWWFSN